MVATKQSEVLGLADQSSCLAKAANDEPIFTLRANDRTSSKTVRQWVQNAKDAGCTNIPKLEEALEWALAAQDWREAHGGGKVPD
jgi:hypothetical protein